jgi:hypothetical protein
VADSEAVAILRETIEDHLREITGSAETDADGDFVVRQGSATVWVRPLDWSEGRTIVRVWSNTNVGVRIDGELTRFLVTENMRFAFGGFGLDEDRATVTFVYTLLGDFMQRSELGVAVRTVAATADEYDDRIRERFGGSLSREVRRVSSELASSEASPRDLAEMMLAAQSSTRQPSGPRVQRVRVAFSALALLAAIGGAIYAYTLESSIWLSVFVALMALQAVGRGVADVITDPDKVRRALYFVVETAAPIAVLYVTYNAWEMWWLAVLLAVFVGGLLAIVLQSVLFPRIHREELEDSARRMAESLKLDSGDAERAEPPARGE